MSKLLEHETGDWRTMTKEQVENAVKGYASMFDVLVEDEELGYDDCSELIKKYRKLFYKYRSILETKF